MRIYVAAALSPLICGGAAWAQSQPNVSQTTGGECSPAVVSQGTVTITCLGLDARQQDMLRKMPGLLEQLLTRSQSDRDEIVGKLEEILKFQRDAEIRDKPREIPDVLFGKLKHELERFNGQEFELTAYQEQHDTVPIALRIDNLLMKAQWQYIPPKGVMIGSTSGIIVSVGTTANAQTTTAARALVTALNEARLEARFVVENGSYNPVDKVNIEVGLKSAPN
jgi:hypothetical protein